MRAKLGSVLVVILLSAFSAFAQNILPTPSVPIGGWDVTFYLSSNVPKRMFIMQLSDGTALFYLAGPRTTAQAVGAPATWSRPAPSSLSFSSEMKLPISNCCMETGTLILKGQLPAMGVMTGRAIFVTDVADPASPSGFVIKTGTFTATSTLVIARSQSKAVN